MLRLVQRLSFEVLLAHHSTYLHKNHENQRYWYKVGYLNSLHSHFPWYFGTTGIWIWGPCEYSIDRTKRLFLVLSWYSGCLLWSCFVSWYPGVFLVAWFYPGSPIFSWYTGFLLLQRFSPGTLVFSWCSDFFLVHWFSSGTLGLFIRRVFPFPHNNKTDRHDIIEHLEQWNTWNI